MTDVTRELIACSAATTEASAVAEIVSQCESRVPWNIEVDDVHGEVQAWLVPPGCKVQVEDLERLGPFPRRHKGDRTLHTALAFSSLVNDLKIQADAEGLNVTRIYGDADSCSIVAVFNDDGTDQPGWRDHTVKVAVRKTEEWVHWAAKDNHMLSQEDFAEHVEAGLAEIAEPAAADMLELAQTFHAKKGVEFESSTVLTSGQRKLVYKETLTAVAGQRGDLVVPNTITLVLSPFEDSDPVRVTARLRYRLVEGHLTIGYKMDRPKIVLRDAFAAICSVVEFSTGLPVLAGLAS